MILNRNKEIGEMYHKNFLIQEKYSDNTTTRILNVAQLIEEIDLMDLSDILEYEIYMIEGIEEFGQLKLKKLHYKGWQPNCLIEIEDEDGNLIVSEYGTDH